MQDPPAARFAKQPTHIFALRADSAAHALFAARYLSGIASVIGLSGRFEHADANSTQLKATGLAPTAADLGIERTEDRRVAGIKAALAGEVRQGLRRTQLGNRLQAGGIDEIRDHGDRKSTRLNSSH